MSVLLPINLDSKMFSVVICADLSKTAQMLGICWERQDIIESKVILNYMRPNSKYKISKIESFQNYIFLQSFLISTEFLHGKQEICKYYLYLEKIIWSMCQHINGNIRNIDQNEHMQTFQEVWKVRTGTWNRNHGRRLLCWLILN